MKNQPDFHHETTDLTKLRLRCPSCAKLYEVESVDIETASPQFQCVGCDCRFSFAYPPMNPENIVCSIVDAYGHLDFTAEQKTCPKCGALSPSEAEECYSCRVIFSRLEGLPEDPTLRAQPSLVRKWKHVMEHFTDEAQHEDFVRSCHQLEALNFAHQKYADMKEALGGDDLCDRMLKRVQKLSEIAVQNSVRELAAVQSAGRAKKWQSYIIPGIYTLCAIFILWGSFSLANRNLVGVGVAIACLLTGVLLSGRGNSSSIARKS